MSMAEGRRPSPQGAAYAQTWNEVSFSTQRWPHQHELRDNGTDGPGTLAAAQGPRAMPLPKRLLPHTSPVCLRYRLPEVTEIRHPPGNVGLGKSKYCAHSVHYWISKSRRRIRIAALQGQG